MEGVLPDGHRAVVIHIADVLVYGVFRLLLGGLIDIDVVDEFLVGSINQVIIKAHVVDVGLDVLHQSALELLLSHFVAYGLETAVGHGIGGNHRKVVTQPIVYDSREFLSEFSQLVMNGSHRAILEEIS